MNTTEITNKLTNLKERIDEAKRLGSEAKGKLDTLMQRLKDEHGVKSLDAAEKLLAKLQGETEAEAKELERGVAELEKMMEGQDG